MSENNFETGVCTMLSMERYIFLPHKFKLNIALFEGTNQYGRYSHLLLDIIDEYEVELKSMGFNTRDLVTQGFRKGVSIMVSDGFA